MRFLAVVTRQIVPQIQPRSLSENCAGTNTIVTVTNYSYQKNERKVKLIDQLIS